MAHLHDRRLIAVSSAWLIVYLLTADLHTSRAAFGATLLLIGINAWVSLQTLTRERRILIGLNCTQIALFGTLHYQLYASFGEEFYECDREPRFYDWIEFTLAHIARAADFLDALDEYGLQIQTIKHASPVSGFLLVCMHLTVDVFLISLVLRWWRGRSQERNMTILERGRREFGWLLATLGLYFVFAVFQQLKPIDWLLWPLDNLLRLFDVGDMFQVFRWKLPSVESNAWTRAAGLLFRLIAGFWVARLGCWARIVVLRTWGLSVDELTELLEDADERVRRNAALGLACTGTVSASAAPALIAALRDFDLDVRTEAARALGEIGRPAAEAVDALTDAAWLGHRELRLVAIEALARIGANSRSTAYSLTTLLKVSDDETRAVVLRALKAPR